MALSDRAAIFLAVSVFALPLCAQENGDPRAGLALARSVCADCHATQPQQLQSPDPRAPAFSELATTPGMTVSALTVALTTPHAGMPMFRLTSDERGHIIAYILSLKPSAPPRPAAEARGDRTGRVRERACGLGQEQGGGEGDC
jgi:mono/diheme cytochrome c family protein